MLGRGLGPGVDGVGFSDARGVDADSGVAEGVGTARTGFLIGAPAGNNLEYGAGV